MMTPRCNALACAAAFVAVACGPSYTVIGSAEEEIDPALVTCQRDSDCTIVEMGCCDTCNGGWSMSVRSDQVDAARQRWASECGQVSCTLLGCAPADQPICVEQRCAVHLPLFDTVVHNPRLKDPRQPGWPPGVGPNGREP